MGWIKKNLKIIGAALLGIIVLLVIFLPKSGPGTGSNDGADGSGLTPEEKVRKEFEEIEARQNKGLGEEGGTDKALITAQDSLRKKFGTPPEGFIWDYDGSPLSLGDKNLEAEEVLFRYLQAISMLNFDSAQFYSRDAKVVETYAGFFDKNNPNLSYEDDFIRNMYKEGILSLEVQGVEDTAVFADDKMVFTVKASVLDLTDKDFWVKDRDKLFKDMYQYDEAESDTAKYEMYLYNYIINHYKSANSKKRVVIFDVAVERYPDLDSGWLVSIDSELDTILQYTDGTLVVDQINDQFRNHIIDMKENGGSPAPAPKPAPKPKSAPSPAPKPSPKPKPSPAPKEADGDNEPPTEAGGATSEKDLDTEGLEELPKGNN